MGIGHVTVPIPLKRGRVGRHCTLKNLPFQRGDVILQIAVLSSMLHVIFQDSTSPLHIPSLPSEFMSNYQSRDSSAWQISYFNN